MKIVADYMEAHSGGTVTDALVQSSGKMVLIAKLLPKLKANGHKVCKERGGREGGKEGRREGGMEGDVLLWMRELVVVGEAIKDCLGLGE